MKTINVKALSQGGAKSTITDNGRIINKYGGEILDQSHSEITIRFADESIIVFSFDDFTTKFGTSNADELAEYLVARGLFSKAPSGGGASLVIDDYIFTDSEERDTYFTTNLSEIKSGLNILVGGVLQVWTDGNAPASYDNTYWHDYSVPLTGEEVLTLLKSNNNVEILETSKKEILDKLSTNNEGNIVSSTSWIFPPNSIYIGNNAILSNALRGLNLTDPVLNKRGLLLAQIYDNSGSQKAFTYKIEAVSTVIANDTIGEVQNTAQFVRTPANDEIIESFHIQTETSNNNTGVDIIVRLDSHTSENEIIRYTKQIQSDINGVVDVILPNPIVTDANLELYIEMNIIGMQGSQVGGVFVPKHTADIQILEREIIVNKNDITNSYNTDEGNNKVVSSTGIYEMYNFFLNPTWIEIDSNDSNITYGGFKMTGKIRRRDLTTGIDTFFQSAETLPIGSSETWVDWGNRESLIYN